MHAEAKCLLLEAVCFTHFGDFRQSMTLLHSGSNVLGICGISGGCLDHAMAMAQGENLLLKSEYGQARSTYSHIIQTHSPDCVCSSYALAIMNIAQIDTKIGRDAEDVHQNLKKAKNILKNYAFRAKIIFCSMFEAEVELREGKFDLAKAKLQECLHSALQNQIELYCLERLADIRAWPTADWQSRWPVVYCGLANKSKARLELHKALLFLGDMFIVNEDEHTATSLYIVALEGFTYMDVHRSRAQCMMRLGDLAKGHGHISDAIAHWKAARPLFERSFQARDVAEIDARLLAVEKVH
jgi:tetratricopeptide (TPR) repeat protein